MKMKIWNCPKSPHYFLNSKTNAELIFEFDKSFKIVIRFYYNRSTGNINLSVKYKYQAQVQFLVLALPKPINELALDYLIYPIKHKINLVFDLAFTPFTVSRPPFTVLFKRIQSRHIHARNEQVNVVRTLIREDGFEVHHVAHARVLVGDAHAAVYLTCLTRYLQCHVYIVAFCHRDLGGGGFAFIGKSAESPCEKLCLRDFGNHLG